MVDSEERGHIEQLKQNYCLGVDTKDWELFGSVFEVDAVLDVSAATTPALSPIYGRDAIVEKVRLTMSGIKSRHYAKLIKLQFVGSRAQGVWEMEDALSPEDGSVDEIMRGTGHYYESYHKRDGRWLCLSVRLTRSPVDHVVQSRPKSQTWGGNSK